MNFGRSNPLVESTAQQHNWFYDNNAQVPPMENHIEDMIKLKIEKWLQNQGV